MTFKRIKFIDKDKLNMDTIKSNIDTEISLEENIKNWFINNFHIHKDWTGSYIEYINSCNDINIVINKFMKDIFNKINNDENFF